MLVGELGLEPSRELQELEQAILRHEPALNGAESSGLTSEVPTTRYARSGEVSIAYQVTGRGPFDVVYVPPFVTNVELMWEIPSWAAFVLQLSSFCRLIRFDKRGTGMSDRVEVGDFETRVDDIRAVMDAAPSPRAALLGASGGGSLSILYAATHPERVWALVLSGTVPYTRRTEDYPIGWSADELAQDVDDELRIWTEPGHAESVAASLGAPEARELAAMWRQSASPGTIREFDERVDELDVRSVLPKIEVPTLVLNREGEDPGVVAGSRYIAEHIPGAVHRLLPGSSDVTFGAGLRQVAGEIERFLREAYAGGAVAA